MDFYCEQVLSGKTRVEVVLETENVLAFHHTRPHWPVHIVVSIGISTRVGQGRILVWAGLGWAEVSFSG